MLRRILCADWWADEVAFELTFSSLMLPTKVSLFQLHACMAEAKKRSSIINAFGVLFGDE